MTNVVVSPNAFKGSLSCTEAAAAMAAAAHIVLPDADLVIRPIADGGDGSVDALLAAGFSPGEVEVQNSDGDMRIARIAGRDDTIVVELANTCGLALSGADLDPMGSSTSALGDAVRGALDAGAREIVLCVGGSASTDGGVGLVTALGARVVDARGADVKPSGGTLRDIVSLDLSGLDARLRTTTLTVASDVDSPLFGPSGAAEVFAPQKGATAQQVVDLDEGLRSWAGIVASTTGADVSERPGVGAAGGTAFAAVALLGAHMVSGADFIADAIGLDQAIAEADIVITGEGSLDAQSLLGKGVVEVALNAQRHGVACVMVCGRIAMESTDLARIGVRAWGALLDIADPNAAMNDAAGLLARRCVEVLAANR